MPSVYWNTYCSYYVTLWPSWTGWTRRSVGSLQRECFIVRIPLVVQMNDIYEETTGRKSCKESCLTITFSPIFPSCFGQRVQWRQRTIKTLLTQLMNECVLIKIKLLFFFFLKKGVWGLENKV